MIIIKDSYDILDNMAVKLNKQIKVKLINK